VHVTFRDIACEHLAGYRKSRLGIDQEGIFLYRGREHLRGHILPSGSERRNLLDPYGTPFFLSEHRTTKLHQFFHHLNSSQGVCLNLFFPLLAEGELDLLARALVSSIAPPFVSTFEKESELEVAERRTSFDFHVRNTENREVFVEVKYTEDGFGGAKDDEEHRNKFQDTYAPLLEESEYLTDECKVPTFFLKNYQILRNLVHITQKSEVRFLIPRANIKVAQQAENAREKFLSESGRGKFQIIYLEDLVLQLIDACRGGKLDGYYESFEHKYLEFVR
jgi:hypothetical protein